MDCNKEEAIRAKVIAEKKMENKDFIGAHKVATKAQHLHPELENIGQIICVCEVHCSAENKKLVNDKDWYSILQVEQSADDTTIKKQYRKFALLLHPDKNKFPGAEAAFKLVGEAQRILLDKEKRSFYDSKYRRFCHPNKPPAQLYKHPNVVKQPWGPPKHEASSNGWETLKTTCPSCFFQFQYYKDDIKPIQCVRCKQLFTPVDISAPYGKSNQTATYTRVDISNQGVKISASNGRFQANYGQPFATKVVGSHSKKKEVSKMNSTAANPVKKEISKKGKKRVIEEVSSDSFDSESSTDYEGTQVDKKTPNDNNGNQRRSSRAKPRVSYNENGSDDDEIKANSNEPLVEEEDKVKENGDAENGYQSEDSDSMPAEDEVAVPDPDFTNFDKLREETPFKTGQLWALYDDKGALPRFYAEIKRVYAGGKKVRINWLEAEPDEGDSILWVNKKLPYACGKFCYGQAETLDDLPMFSHLMLPKLGKNVPIRVYPKSNQIWALFRDWSMNWISKADAQIDYEYDFVEVLSEYDETVGIRVVLLIKLKGFTCVFCRKGGDAEVQIPPNELLRFSHNVPSCRIEGKEMEGVPYGSIELDPASLPASLLNK